jgi:hypothetical protein
MKTRKSPKCHHSEACICSHGRVPEEAILLVLQSQNWNPFLIAAMAPVCRWFGELAKQHLWKLFCCSRGPKRVSDLLLSGSRSAIGGGWDALGRLMIYCPGASSRGRISGCGISENGRISGRGISENGRISGHGISENGRISRHGILENGRISGRGISGENLGVRPHFARTTRFSKTSGRSFLVPECRSDVLYVSDPCEHQRKKLNSSYGVDEEEDDDDTGIFRGIFCDFLNSGTRRLLVELCVKLEAKDLICPYCFNRVWSLLQANMIPKSAHRRLAAHGDLEYFVCLNGHVYGSCSLLHLSSDDDSNVSSG